MPAEFAKVLVMLKTMPVKGPLMSEWTTRNPPVVQRFPTDEPMVIRAMRMIPPPPPSGTTAAMAARQAANVSRAMELNNFLRVDVVIQRFLLMQSCTLPVEEVMRMPILGMAQMSPF